uniref:Uncharacterized protein n=1 Tax=Glossina morsitans morsitans TaxID=37546 RepID=A0A1B0G3I1_GLOMM
MFFYELRCSLFAMRFINFRRSYSVLSEGKEILVERLAGNQSGITVLGLNRSEAKNAFSRDLVDTFSDILVDLKTDNSSRVVVLRNLTPGVFCAGADLKERQEREISTRSTFLKLAK